MSFNMQHSDKKKLKELRKKEEKEKSNKKKATSKNEVGKAIDETEEEVQTDVLPATTNPMNQQPPMDDTRAQQQTTDNAKSDDAAADDLNAPWVPENPDPTHFRDHFDDQGTHHFVTVGRMTIDGIIYPANKIVHPDHIKLARKEKVQTAKNDGDNMSDISKESKKKALPLEKDKAAKKQSMATRPDQSVRSSMTLQRRTEVLNFQTEYNDVMSRYFTKVKDDDDLLQIKKGKHIKYAGEDFKEHSYVRKDYATVWAEELAKKRIRNDNSKEKRLKATYGVNYQTPAQRQSAESEDASSKRQRLCVVR